MYTPIVIEQDGQNERAYDIYSRLLKDNIIFIGDVIDDDMANSVIGQLLFLNEESSGPVRMYINSPGGSVTAGLAILDTMDFVRSPIHTYCVGQAASMAAVLLAKGKKGKRFSLPHSRIMIHQPSMHYLSGQATDIQIYAKEIQEMKEILVDLLAEATGQTKEKLFADMERDFFMRPEAAKEYGLIDAIKVRDKSKKDEDED
jgi:ATP-dependent Clp protease, protease subunit